MPQRHIDAAALALNSGRAVAWDLARLAASQRERSLSAPNEVVASVHQSLAARYGAMAQHPRQWYPMTYRGVR
jgi:hypothetical protein